MEIFSTIKLALTSIKTNKGRSFLTMLGIIIGITAVTIIISVGAGAQSLILNQIQSLGSNLVGVLPGQGGEDGPPAAAFGVVITTLKAEDARSLGKIPHVVAATAYARGQEQISYENKNISAPLNGVMASYPNVIDHQIEKGRFFNKQEEKNLSKVAVLGYGIKEKLFLNEDPIGKTVKIKTEKFKVIGYLEEKGVVAFQDVDSQVYLPISTTQKILTGANHVGLIRAKIDEEQYVESTMEEIRRTLRINHKIKNIEDDDFAVLSANSALSAIESVTNIIKFVLAAVAAISLLVGGIGIMNIMLVVINERTREIGLRKAIGAKQSHIKNQFLIESLVITSVGGIIGIILGIFFTTLVAIIIRVLGYTWKLSFAFDAMLIGLLVSFIIGVVFGYYPAKKAAKLNAIEALRYE